MDSHGLCYANELTGLDGLSRNRRLTGAVHQVTNAPASRSR
jgi:hypothetical protein